MPLDDRAAESPVDWSPWGPAVFERARREGKPVVLRISAVWCHWCHVMDETTDSDAEVARRMNEWFVPVRVDNDERPDVNDRYNLGGWPTTAFLTPDGDLITGGTYFPASQFRDVLERVHRGWTENRQAIDAEVARIRARKDEARATVVVDETLAGGAVADAVEAVLAAFDWRYGGFGSQPKFPQPEAVRLLLHAHAGSGAEHPREAAEKTLVAMCTAGREEGRSYGLYDHVAGGFFRYSTTRDWSAPHFEKMAEDNARLALTYLDAWRLLGEELYADTVRGVLGFVLETLSDPAGGAWGSQDADGEAEYYGLAAEGRERLPAPHVDRRIYAGWSALMARAMFEAGAALDWPEARAWALATVERLTESLSTPEGTLRHVLRPFAPVSDRVDLEAPLLLGDQAWGLAALHAAYQATGEPSWLERAERLATAVEGAFLDAERGAFRDRADGPAQGPLDEARWPLAENSFLAEALAEHAALDRGERWREMAGRALAATAGEARRHGFLGAVHGLAAAHVLADPIRVHLVGLADDPALRALWRASWAAYLPARVTEILDPQANAARLGILGYPTDGPPRAYVCLGDRCLEPARAPEELAERLERIEA